MAFLFILASFDLEQVWVLVGSGEDVAINCDTNTDGYAHIVLDGETLDSMNTFFPLLVDQVISSVTIQKRITFIT